MATATRTRPHGSAAGRLERPRLSGWCGLHGRPDCEHCHVADCDHECHDQKAGA